MDVLGRVMCAQPPLFPKNKSSEGFRFPNPKEPSIDDQSRVIVPSKDSDWTPILAPAPKESRRSHLAQLVSTSHPFPPLRER